MIVKSTVLALQSQCPIYVQVTEFDPWNDVGILHAMALKDGNFKVKIDMIARSSHQDFVTLMDSKVDLTDLQTLTTEGMS